MGVEASLNKLLYKLELYLLKVIPSVLAFTTLLDTILFYFGINIEVLSYLGGVSFITLLFLFISSFTFKFCIYHRLPLYYTTIINCINTYFNRWYADMSYSGIAIDWEDML